MLINDTHRPALFVFKNWNVRDDKFINQFRCLIHNAFPLTKVFKMNIKSLSVKSMKFALCLSILLGTLISSASAQTVANCGSVEGYAYYHFAGLVPKKSSGFDKDKITGGMTTFQKMPDGSYDILVVDSRKKIISMVQDGGKVVLLRKGAKDATFMLYFPNNSIEIYTLWIDGEGALKYDYLSSKGGDATGVHKSSVMVGRCDEINFNLISN